MLETISLRVLCTRCDSRYTYLLPPRLRFLQAPRSHFGRQRSLSYVFQELVPEFSSFVPILRSRVLLSPIPVQRLKTKRQNPIFASIETVSSLWQGESPI